MVDEESEAAESWWKNNRNGVISGVLGSLLAQGLVVVVFYGIPEAMEFMSDAHATLVVWTYFGSGISSVFFGICAVFLLVVPMKTVDWGKRQKSISTNILNTAFTAGLLLAGYFMLMGLFHHFAYIDAKAMRGDIVAARTNISDSTFHDIRSAITEIESNEDLQAVRARIDSLNQD